jgi:hypothetical protein
MREGYVQPQSKEITMGFNPKDAVDSAKDIATNAIDKSGGIVEAAAEALKGGDLSGAAGDIIKSATDIATGSVEGAKDMLIGKADDAAE